MKIQREDFLNDLNMVKPGLSPREFVEQSSCFVFREGTVMTFNDEVCCRKEVPLNITGAVQATTLLAILEKLEDPELKVRLNDDKELEFKGNGKGFGVTIEAEIFLPVDKVEMPEKWRPLPKEFTEAVGLVQHCVSTDESKFKLTCIHLHPDFIEASDNLQIMRVKIATGLKNPTLIRGTSLQHITHLAMDEICMTKTWVHFRNQAGLIFSCRRYDEEYHDLSQFIKIKGHSIVIPKGMSMASDRAAVFAAEKSGEPLVNVCLDGSKGLMRLKGKGLVGWYKEIKSVAYDGPYMSFFIAPDLLKHISERYSEAEIEEGKLKVSGGSWEYVTFLGDEEEEKEEADEND